ncbi:hypothetical protein M9978_08190 [Sphingomonas sp. MG17]|uniref:Uncharacterized protein n=1 Tax=Sphingomonas tagetis TaxID=2949092 RepID=A0A9X2KLH5_9SPHN|nr:hypothetical protein [Sphingomonas tagetis]MCP3730406.1 hypothetical protein [Sphingomonas tagetis]
MNRDPHGTVFIDTDSDAGSWIEAIANTPHLARQCAADPLETYERDSAHPESNLND